MATLELILTGAALARSSLGVLAAVTLACVGPADVVEVPAAGARAALILSKADAYPDRLEAIELSGEERYLAAPRRSASEVFDVIEYGCPPQDLGIAPGPMAIMTAGAAFPLPAARVFQAGAFGLRTLSEPPEHILAIRFLPSRGAPWECGRFRAESIRAGGLDQAFAMSVSLGPDTALFATREGRFFRASKGGLLPLASLATSAPHLAGFFAGDDTLWLLGAGGQLLRGSVEGLEAQLAGFTEAPPLDALTGAGPSDPIAMTGAPGAPFELFVSIGGRTLHRFDGERWSLVTDQGDGGAAGLVWIGPGEVLATGLRAGGVLHVLGASVRVEPLPDAPLAIAEVRGYGILAATRGGILFRRGAEGTWEKIGESDLSAGPVVAIARFGAGLLLGEGAGRLAEYRPEAGFCPPVQDAQRIEAILPLGEGAVVAGTDRLDRLAITLLTPLAEGPSLDCRRLPSDPHAVPQCTYLVDPLAGASGELFHHVVRTREAERCTLEVDSASPVPVPCASTGTTAAPGMTIDGVGHHRAVLTAIGAGGSARCEIGFEVLPPER